jgi:hypothetical protein
MLKCVGQVTMFPFQAHQWLAMDFVGPDLSPEEVREATRLRRSRIFWAVPRLVVGALRKISGLSLSKPRIEDQERGVVDSSPEIFNRNEAHANDIAFSKMEDHRPDFRSPYCSPTPTIVGFPLSRVPSPTPTILSTPDDERSLPGSDGELSKDCVKPAPEYDDLAKPSPSPSAVPRRPTALRAISTLINVLTTPQTLSIIFSLIIAFIKPLKALFVPMPSSYTTSLHIHTAPDGGPPLAVILDAAAFMGTASVPLGLIALGSALARIRLPRSELRMLPLGAIGALAVLKMLVMPVFGVALVRGLVYAGFIPAQDKVLQFVCM